MDRWRRGLALLLGLVFITAGIFESVRAVTSGDGGIPFWFGTLCGGGALILVGAFVLTARPWLSFALTALGCLAGSVATAWTLFLPLVAVALIVLALLHAMTPRALAPGGE